MATMGLPRLHARVALSLMMKKQFPKMPGEMLIGNAKCIEHEVLPNAA